MSERRSGPFSPMTRGAARAFVVMSAVTLAVALIGFLWTAAVVNEANARARALCQFDADLGTAPLTVPKGARASRFGVLIISDARTAWHRTGCPGRLGAPDPSFVKWARYYHLPAG